MGRPKKSEAKPIDEPTAEGVITTPPEPEVTAGEPVEEPVAPNEILPAEPIGGEDAPKENPQDESTESPAPEVKDEPKQVPPAVLVIDGKEYVVDKKILFQLLYAFVQQANVNQSAVARKNIVGKMLGLGHKENDELWEKVKKERL